MASESRAATFLIAPREKSMIEEGMVWCIETPVCRLGGLACVEGVARREKAREGGR
jgi:hypothetical protein